MSYILELHVDHEVLLLLRFCLFVCLLLLLLLLSVLFLLLFCRCCL